MQTRRRFIALAASTVAVLTLPLTGCDTTTVAAFVNLIADYAGQLATYFGAGNIAAQITTLAGTIATDIANWQNGQSPAADAIAALTDLEGLINQIPITDPYAPLIELLLGAVTGLLALLPNALTGPRAIRLKHNVVPKHYGGFDKKSMTAAKTDLTTQWKSLTQSLTVKK